MFFVNDRSEKGNKNGGEVFHFIHSERYIL